MDWFFLKKPSILYIVPSSNMKGFYRDLLIYLPFLIFRKRIICHIRSGSFILKEGVFNKLYSLNNFRFIFLTKILADYSLIKQKNYIVIPNFIDEIFETTQSTDKDVLSKPIKLIYLSNLFKSKGIFNIIDAVKQIDDYSFELNIYGKGEESVVNVIKESIKENKNIFYKESLSNRQEVKKALRESDIFVLPTTYKIEASPRSIIEAMSQYCVPLVTNHAGIPNMVDVACAFIINKEKDITEELKEVLQYVSKNEEVLYNKKIESRNKFESIFSYQIIRQLIYSFFDKNFKI
jgi:glycosyltransferase involved in cell wall biosynthesis